MSDFPVGTMVKITEFHEDDAYSKHGGTERFIGKTVKLTSEARPTSTEGLYNGFYSVGVDLEDAFFFAVKLEAIKETVV